MTKKPKQPATPPRMEKVENIIRLIHQMASFSQGVTITGIMEDYAVSRRTAERMLNVVKAIYGSQIETSIVDQQRHAFRLPTIYRQGPLSFSPQELSALESAVTLARRYKADELASGIEAISLRLRSLAKAHIKRDAEDMADLEDVGLLAGPRIKFNPAILALIKQAILSWNKLRLDYTYISTGERHLRVVHPYGILYGPRTYLVAISETSQDYRYYSLGHIHEVEILPETFTRDEGFSLKAYVQRSFGSYQELPYEVVWKVSANKADEAHNFNFHPTQIIKPQPDGSLLIKFRAGGLKEMCHHLFTWEGEIEIIAPPELKTMMAKMLDAFKR